MNGRFKITSSGKPFDTRVIDLHTGQPVGFVQKITWSVSTEDQLPRCVIEIVGVEMDVECEAAVLKTGFFKTGNKKTERKDETRSSFVSDDADFEAVCKSLEDEVAADQTVKKTKKSKKKA